MAKSRTISTTVPALGLALVLVSCASLTPQKEAVCRFADLKEAGKLPGFHPADHGTIETERIPFGKHLSYPASLTVYARKENDPAKYAYQFTKDTAADQWKLTRATRIPPDGQREELLPFGEGP